MVVNKLDFHILQYGWHCAKKGLKDSSIQNKIYVLKDFSSWLTDQKIQSFSSVNHEHIQDYIHKVSVRGKKGGKKHLEKSLVRKRNFILRFLSFLEDSGAIEEIPTKEPDCSTRFPHELTMDHVIAMSHATMTDNEAALLRLFAQSGLTLREVLKLKVSDIDLVNREVHVASSQLRLKHTSFFTNESRIVISRVIEQAKREKRTRVFNLTKDTAHQRMERLGKRAGVPFQVCPELLRRFFLKEIVLHGISPAAIVAISGQKFCPRIPSASTPTFELTQPKYDKLHPMAQAHD